MSQFHFTDEEKPNPPASGSPEPAPPAAPAAPAPAEEEDDFSFLAETPAPAPAPSAPQQPTVAAPGAAPGAAPTNASAPASAGRVKVGADQARMPGQALPRPQNQAASGAAPSTAAPASPRAPRAASATPEPLKPRVARVATPHFDPAAVHPVGVPSPAAAPNPAAAAALTPTLNEPLAEDTTGLETGEKIAAGLFSAGTSVRRALDMVAGPAMWLLRVSVIAGLLCLAFLLAAMLFGGGANVQTNPKAVDLARNLTYAAQGFSVCLLVATIASLLLSYEDNKLGAIIFAVGVALQFGAPLLVKATLGDNFVGLSVVGPLVMVGRVLFYIGAIKGAIDLFDFVLKLPERVKTRQADVGKGRPTEAKQRAIASQANMMSPCWKLPFCREAIRVLCPAFIAKTTCWKFGRGCYCDEEMIGRIVRGEPMESIKAPTRISQSKPPCGRCYIYLEHQTYKFRMLSPLALPLTIAIAFVGYPLYQAAFRVFDKGLQSVWSTFSFSTKSLTPEAMQATKEASKAAADATMNAAQVSGFAQTILGVMLGFFLLIYIAKGIEWAIFKAKL